MYSKNRRLAVIVLLMLGTAVTQSGCVTTSGQMVPEQDAGQPTPPTAVRGAKGDDVTLPPVRVGQLPPPVKMPTGQPTTPYTVQPAPYSAPSATPTPTTPFPGPGSSAQMPYRPMQPGMMPGAGGMPHGGIQAVPPHGQGGPGIPPGPGPMPRELFMSSHQPYTVAPPDILYLDALRLIPKPPYRIEPLEILIVNVTNTLPNQPIQGPYTVSPEGTVNLGFGYGAVRVGGLTLDQAQEAVRNQLGNVLRNAQVNIALAQFRGSQQISGQHLVRPDGTISLGTFGSVYVAGMTMGQIKAVVEKHLSAYLMDPQVAVDVFAYNSKVYYVIFDGGGYGQQIFRLPATGNETVLDAIGMVQGLAPVSSKKKIWLARPSPFNMGANQIMPVDWNAITQAGSTATNYQLFPGDRIYVRANCLIEFDNRLAQILNPIERIFGITFLGVNTVNAFRNGGNTTGVIIP